MRTRIAVATAVGVAASAALIAGLAATPASYSAAEVPSQNTQSPSTSTVGLTRNATITITRMTTDDGRVFDCRYTGWVNMFDGVGEATGTCTNLATHQTQKQNMSVFNGTKLPNAFNADAAFIPVERNSNTAFFANGRWETSTGDGDVYVGSINGGQITLTVQ